jgi:hypothetical protein
VATDSGAPPPFPTAASGNPLDDVLGNPIDVGGSQLMVDLDLYIAYVNSPNINGINSIIDVNVANNGSVSPDRPFTVTLCVTDPPGGSTIGLHCESKDVDFAGATGKIVTFSIPTEARGIYASVTATVDSLYQIEEYDETNNSLTRQMSFSG